MLVVLVMGVNLTLWLVAGAVRLADDTVVRRRPPPRHRPGSGGPTAADIAVLVPAHDEARVLGQALTSLLTHFPAANVHVVSDASTDATVRIAQDHGVGVVETGRSRGKAGALAFGIRHFDLLDRFAAVMIIDADTRLADSYLPAALALLDDEDVAVVAGCAQTDWASTRALGTGRVVVAHRARMYALVQRLMKYGQAGRLVNAVQIVPGFASIYRTSALRHIRIDPPGLVIEDFHMTFEVYRQRLGRVGFSTRAVALTQDPDNLAEYVRQVRRWCLGFWQSVRRFRGRPDLFAWALALLVLELAVSSVVILGCAAAALVLGFGQLMPWLDEWTPFYLAHTWVDAYFSLPTLLLGVVLPDLVLTLVAVVADRRPAYLLYAPLFLPLRMVDAVVFLWTMLTVWGTRSTGVWTSPTRRPAARPDPVRARAG